MRHRRAVESMRAYGKPTGRFQAERDPTATPQNQTLNAAVAKPISGNEALGVKPAPNLSPRKQASMDTHFISQRAQDKRHLCVDRLSYWPTVIRFSTRQANTPRCLFEQVFMKTQREVRWQATEGQSVQIQPFKTIAVILRPINEIANLRLHHDLVLARF